MDKKELNFILQEGEGLKLEFKESLNNLDKELAAFVNSSGGRIFLGVSDSGKIKGINITNKLKSEIQDIANNCDPKIKIKLESYENILIIHVEEGSDKPYKCSSGFYLRQGPNSQKMKRGEIIDLIHDSGKIRFDAKINNKFDINRDLDKNKLNKFLQLAKITKNLSTEEILTNLSVAEKLGKIVIINNAGILLFAKEPEKFLRQNFVTCILYKGKEKVDVIDRKDFKQDLLENYEDTFAFLKQHLRLEYEIKGYGPRKEIPEIPYEALREAVINAIIHRDYFDDSFGIFVEIFDDRVEITDRGKLLFDRKELGKVSAPRNPIIFDMFHRLNLIEKIGSGINRIKKQTKERGLKVKFETEDFFRVIFYRSSIEKKGERVGERVGEKLTKNQEKILELINKNSSVSATELSSLIGISSRKIEENISKLKQKGLLKRIGPAKGGYWKIKRGSE